ncbi:DUF6279 family lipoprotein [Aliiglaciecola lipolytica]|uniref:Lipoprotein n=1 Tax=Aliiglaciecola lipolytica E3 TaxID=1127673 RepID=K6XRC1_9ALTE|nr:DUF6279 family lipoprotein [Aliiglaciecola lipolytica]GAC14236.1 hypothetical protein GLIP_1602 [Aliiglaciecola lipolytica E3]
MFKHLLFCFCAVVLLLTGCTSKFSYNNVDWLLYWYVDDYVELEKSQKKRLDVKVEKWLKWHRQEELVRYRQHLEELKSQVEQGNISEEQWLSHLARASSHWQRFRDEISLELSELSVYLNDQQIIDMFEALEKDNLEKVEKRNKKTEQERWQENKEDTTEQMQDWLGRLSEQQKILISESVEKFESTFESWIEYRREIQSASKNLMLNREKQSDYIEQFNQLIQNPDQFKSESYIKASQHNRKVYAALLADLLPTISEKQKRHLIKEIDDLIDDIQDLIED